MEITRGIRKKPLRLVIYGPEGIGKTTFASRFPKPLFIDTEDSSDFLDVDRLPKPSSWTMLLKEIDEAKKLAGQYQTLVLDTADWAETLCKNEIISTRQLNGIEDMGYGKGYVYLAEKWGAMLNKLTEVRDAGMNVVITAHSALRKFEQPDEMGAYDRYELKLEKKTAPLLKEWADAMLFANYETYVVKEAGKEKSAKGKVQGGRRVMYTSHHPCWDAKNRQGLPDKLPFDFCQIAQCVPDAPCPEPQPEPRPEPARREPPAEMPEAAPAQAVELPTTAEREDAPLPFPDTPAEQTRDTVPKALQDMMDQADVTEDEVRDVIAQKEYFTRDTPWSVMADAGFVDGWILPFWDRIVEMIRSNPNRIPF